MAFFWNAKPPSDRSCSRKFYQTVMCSRDILAIVKVALKMSNSLVSLSEYRHPSANDHKHRYIERSAQNFATLRTSQPHNRKSCEHRPLGRIFQTKWKNCRNHFQRLHPKKNRKRKRRSSSSEEGRRMLSAKKQKESQLRTLQIQNQ